MGEIWRGAELLIYNGEIFSAANLPLKLPNILITFWNSEILKGSVLHGYNEGLFLWSVSRQICQTFKDLLGRCSFAALRVTDI